jgi:putative transposase
VFFLDESGFGLSLPPTYAWARKGEAVRVPRAWGKSGRVNAVAHLERRSCGGWGLGYALLEGRCGTGEVVAYLEGLSREVAREGVRGVVFLDNAPFHRSVIQPPQLRHFHPASRVMSCMLCPSASSITSFGVR